MYALEVNHHNFLSLGHKFINLVFAFLSALTFCLSLVDLFVCLFVCLSL